VNIILTQIFIANVLNDYFVDSINEIVGNILVVNEYAMSPNAANVYLNAFPEATECEIIMYVS